MKFAPVAVRKCDRPPKYICNIEYTDKYLLEWQAQATRYIFEIKEKGNDLLEKARIHLKSALKTATKTQKDAEWHKVHTDVKKIIGEMMHYILSGLYKNLTKIDFHYKEIKIDENIFNTPQYRVPYLMIGSYSKIDNFWAYCPSSADLIRIQDVPYLLEESVKYTIINIQAYSPHIHSQELAEIHKRSIVKLDEAVEKYCDRKDNEILETSLPVLLERCFTDFMKIVDAVIQSVMTELLAVSKLKLF